MVQTEYVRIEEHPVPGKPLGRHVNHDPRSKSFAVKSNAALAVSKLWERKVPILDQGDVGSCTGNASVGVLGTLNNWTLLQGKGLKFDEAEALEFYRQATILDSYPGTYPQEDTGSDGLSVAKAVLNAGYIKGYTHCLSLDAVITALQNGPLITGVNWYDSFDSPDSSGFVQITAGAQVRGGHEFEILGVDVLSKTFRAANSWGTSFGDKGYFSFSYATMSRLLAEQGDATYFVPLDQPAPVPTPPTPTPGGVDPDVQAWWDKVGTWAQSKHIYANKKAAVASVALAKAKGLI